MTRSALDTVTDNTTAASPSGRGPGLSLFYLEEPDIPEGVTCTEWRGRRRRDAKRGLLAQVRARLRWHQLREAPS